MGATSRLLLLVLLGHLWGLSSNLSRTCQRYVNLTCTPITATDQTTLKSNEIKKKKLGRKLYRKFRVYPFVIVVASLVRWWERRVMWAKWKFIECCKELEGWTWKWWVTEETEGGNIQRRKVCKILLFILSFSWQYIWTFPPTKMLSEYWVSNSNSCWVAHKRLQLIQHKVDNENKNLTITKFSAHNKTPP